MDDYSILFREIISLRGLTDLTAKSYSTYIKTYLFYLSEILHKTPEKISWSDLREFVRWLQKEKGLSDKTINHCISQLRFFTLYVLHKPWNPTQLPLRKFDSYLPYVPTQEETWQFIFSIISCTAPASICAKYFSYISTGSFTDILCGFCSFLLPTLFQLPLS